MKILVTGFDPFGDDCINPAIEAVKRLPDCIDNATIIKLEIPTVAYKSLERIKEAIEKYDPDMILSVGQAGGRNDISVERVGINVNDFRICDNEGNQPIDEPIFKDGNAAYFSTLPIKSMVKEIRKAKIPASISNTAGTFVCNHVLYGVCYMIDKEFKGKKSGFIHIPFLPEQVVKRAGCASMSLDTVTTALIQAIKAMIQNEEDCKTIEGKIC